MVSINGNRKGFINFTAIYYNISEYVQLKSEKAVAWGVNIPYYGYMIHLKWIPFKKLKTEKLTVKFLRTSFGRHKISNSIKLMTHFFPALKLKIKASGRQKQYRDSASSSMHLRKQTLKNFICKASMKTSKNFTYQIIHWQKLRRRGIFKAMISEW